MEHNADTLGNSYQDPGYDFDRESALTFLPLVKPLVSESKIQIQELNLEEELYPNLQSMQALEGGGRYLIIGRPASGKSVLIKDILYSKKNIIPTYLAVSTTEGFNKFYQSMIPSLFVYNEFSTTIINDLIAHQKEKIERMQKESSSPSKEQHSGTFTAFIMDDCASDCKILNSKEVEDLAKNGRHFNLLFLITTQYVTDLKPDVRGMFDGVFIMRNPVEDDRKKIYKKVTSIVPTYALFCKLMDEMTEDNGCLFFNNRSTSNNWQDCFRWYRAQQREAFKLGSPAFQSFAADRMKGE
jgi:hypothetical protein